VTERICHRPAARLPVLAALVLASFALPAPVAHAATDQTDAVVARVNEERESAGCSPVRVSRELTSAARGHSQDQADHEEMSHTGSDGSSAGERITRAGYAWSRMGENVAMGTTSSARVMEMWMESSGHRKNILNCAFQHIGIAQVDGYWTQVFARPR
jgi:uncharacterized protein YkwD